MGKGQAQIANTIRTLRFHAGEMTQAALAEKVGVTRQTIVAIEQGQDILITATERGVRVQDLHLDEGATVAEADDLSFVTGFADPYYLILNAIEGLDPVIAMGP